MKSTDRIEKEIFLKAPIPRVWQAIADSKEFGLWFGMKFDGPFAAGRPVRGVITPTTVDPEVAKQQKPYEGFAFEIIIDQIVPETLFSFRWHPYAVDRTMDYSSEPMTLIEFQLHAVKGGTMLTLVESGFDKLPQERSAEAYRMNSGGWEKQMTNIQRYVERP